MNNNKYRHKKTGAICRLALPIDAFGNKRKIRIVWDDPYNTVGAVSRDELLADFDTV